MSPTVVLWAFLGVFYTSITLIASNSPLYLGISAKRNKTGYWIAQLDMDHSLSVDWTILEKFEVSVDVDIKPCKNGEIFHFTFDITVPTVAARRNTFKPFQLHPELDAAFSWSGQMRAPWQEAAQLCRKERSHLAVVSSMDVAAKVAQELPQEEAAFVGIRYDNGSYVDPFGAPVDVEPWLLMTPHNGSEACYVLDRSLLLFPEPCHVQKPFICERSFA